MSEVIEVSAPLFRERCRRECTRDVIFLFQYRSEGSKRNTMTWHTDGVFLTREEGEAFGKSTDYRYPGRWRVYGVPANGTLVDLIRNS